MKHLTLIAAMALSGCSTISPYTVATETTWQALNVLDTGQTISIARNPQAYQEVDRVSRTLVGAHPSEARVYALMGAYAVVHAGITLGLDAQDPGHGAWHVASIGWQALTLGDKARAVIDNSRMHVDPWMGTRAGPQLIAVPVNCAANVCTN